MAEIFLARSTGMAGLERHVVLKRVLPERARDPAFVAMFLDEARLAAQLHHPNIAQVYDIGKLGDSYFFTMEYVHGENVRELLLRLAAMRRQIAVGDALTIVAGVAAGLHHAHERRGQDRRPLGIVHRDVSPANVIVSYEGSVKVVDFGIAKANQRNAADTRTGSVKGKVAYMSPEQCKGKELDRRSDIFSLGIVLWELCTGQRLFKYETDFDTMSAIVYNEPPPPSHLRPGVPGEVDKIIATAMDKDVDRRYATAADMLEALEGVAVRTGHPLSTTALGRTIRGLFGDRPEPWIALRDAGPQGPITVTGESFDLQIEDVAKEVAAAEVKLVAVAATLPTGPSVEEMLRRTNPIPRETKDRLRAHVASTPPPPQVSASSSVVTTSKSAPPEGMLDPGPQDTLPLPAADIPGERIATRRGHVPAHRVAAARKLRDSASGSGRGSGSSNALAIEGSRPSQPALGSGSEPPTASPPSAPASGIGSTGERGTLDAATGSGLDVARPRSLAPLILIIVSIIAIGGMALGWYLAG